MALAEYVITTIQIWYKRYSFFTEDLQEKHHKVKQHRIRIMVQSLVSCLYLFRCSNSHTCALIVNKFSLLEQIGQDV